MTRLDPLAGDPASRQTPHTRSERLIAWGRVVLAVVALVAVWIAPDEPRRPPAVTYAALAAYVAYALAVAVAVARPPAPPPWLPLATQAVDMAASPLLMYLTEGPASPFFLYFLFPLLSATLRWHVRGTALTAGIQLAVFLALGAWVWRTQPSASLDPSRFVIRAAFLGVMAVLLGSLGAHSELLRAPLLRLARGPRSIASDAGELAQAALHQAAVLDAPRVVLVWEDGEEPWLNIAASVQCEMTVAREPPATWEPLVAEPLGEAAFLCADAGAAAPVVDRETAGGFERWRGAPLHPAFRARFAVRSVASVPVRGAHIAGGRLFWLDRPGFTADDLMLGAIVARQAASLLDQIVLRQRLHRAAAAEERVRLSHDLHDGLLQSLAAAALQLQAARSALDSGGDIAARRLAEVQRLLAEEQRSLRQFLWEMWPGGAPDSETAPLAERVRALVERVGREWGLAVRATVEELGAPLGDGLERQVYLMVQEAVTNAARHAGARSVLVEVAARDGRLRLVVEDDGQGFPFAGRRDGDQLAAAGKGPVSLRERAALLGGAIVVDSSPRGARVQIDLPLGAGEA
jgi:signal transduction histidine kinase